jgi:hypothetical protein
MSIIKLPMTKPIIRVYTNYAYQFSILGSYIEAQPWFFMNFIQLCTEEDCESPLIFNNRDDYGYCFNITTPFFECKILTRDFILSQKLDFKSLIIESIKSGEYVYFYINEKYIPDTRASESNFDNNHNIMIHGVDIELNEVYFYSYNKDSIFIENKIPLDQLSIAYFSNKVDFPRFEDRFYIFHITKDKGLVLTISLKIILEQMISLRDSYVLGLNVIDYHKNIHIIYGLKTFDKLAKSLSLMAKNQIRIDIRSLHLLMEHKALMVLRLQYIEHHKPDIVLGEFIKEYEKLERRYGYLRNLLLLFQTSNKNTSIQKIADEILVLKDREYDLLNRLITYLADYNIES